MTAVAPQGPAFTSKSSQLVGRAAVSAATPDEYTMTYSWVLICSGLDVTGKLASAARVWPCGYSCRDSGLVEVLQGCRYYYKVHWELAWNNRWSWLMLYVTDMRCPIRLPVIRLVRKQCSDQISLTAVYKWGLVADVIGWLCDKLSGFVGERERECVCVCVGGGVRGSRFGNSILILVTCSGQANVKKKGK